MAEILLSKILIIRWKSWPFVEQLYVPSTVLTVTHVLSFNHCFIGRYSDHPTFIIRGIESEGVCIKSHSQ